MTSSNILEQLVELTGNVADAFTVALYGADPVNKTLTHQASLSLSAHFDPRAVFHYGKGPLGLAALNQEALLVDEVDEDTELPGIYDHAEGIQSYMILPVVHKDLEGVLVVDTKERFGFSTKVQKLVRGFTGQMAWHLRHERERETGPGSEVFPYREMIRFSQALVESQDRMKLAERLVHLPDTLLDCDAMAVISFESEEDQGKILRHRGWGQNLLELAIYKGKGVVGSCAKNNIPILVTDKEKRKSILFSGKEDLEPFKCRMAVPVTVEGEVLAVLACGSKNPQGFSFADLLRLSLVASFASASLQCAEIRRQWDYEKFLDPITQLPNHRFLAEYRDAVEKQTLGQNKPLSVLMVKLKNLPDLYEMHGVDLGDRLLKRVVTLLSNAVPSPKHIFKYSEMAFLVFLLDKRRDEDEHLDNRLKMAFDENPVFIDKKSIPVEIELGLASFPVDGKNLSDLIATGWARASQQLKVIP